MTNKVVYVPGESNVADFLSRPDPTPLLHVVLPHSSGVIDYLELAETQSADPDLASLWLKNTSSLVLQKVPLAEYGFELICDSSAGPLRLVNPKDFRFRIFKHYHCLSHPGVKTTKRIITFYHTQPLFIPS